MSSIRTCKVKWGISCLLWGRHYDHGLVECTFRATLAVRKVQPTKDFSVLKNDREIRQRFDEKVSTNLTQSTFNQENPTETLINLHNAINVATSVLPCKKNLPTRKRHVSARTKQLYEDRQSKFSKMSQEDRKSASNAISNSIRDDYISYLDRILSDMEAADRTGNTREMSRLSKLLSGKSKSSMTTPSKDMQGNLILSQYHLLSAWNEFLSQKFASPDADNDCLREHKSAHMIHSAIRSLRKHWRHSKVAKHLVLT